MVKVVAYLVTHYRHGQVLETRSLGERWVPVGTALGRQVDGTVLAAA